MQTHPQTPDPDRRSFLKWATHGLGAIFGAILGFPVLCYSIDPRNRPNPPGDLRVVSGVRLSEITEAPTQGAIRGVRHDAWTLYPNDVIGRVWIRRVKPGKTKDCYEVFSTVCPHLGCAINCNSNQQENAGYTCPCHDGQFNLDGSLKPNRPGYDNPAPRGMDSLTFDVLKDPDNLDPENLDRLVVKYENFKKAQEAKETMA